MRRLSVLILGLSLFVVGACPGKEASKDGGRETKEETPVAASGQLDVNVQEVLAALVELETERDVTCWTSFRQLDWYIAEKAYDEFGTLAKIRAMKSLVRSTWSQASSHAAGPTITVADFDAAVNLPDVALDPKQQEELASFANDVGFQNYTDYQKTAEHLRLVLAVLQDEIYGGGDAALKPMEKDAVFRLANAATTLSLHLLKASGVSAEADKSNLVTGKHVEEARAKIAKKFGLPDAKLEAHPLSGEAVALRLRPLTKQLIEGKAKALENFNRGSKETLVDLNKVSRIPLDEGALAVLLKDVQSFAHFVTAGFEPMRADNYLSDGSFAPTMMQRVDYVDEVRVQNAVIQIFPHKVLPNGDVQVRFEPNPGPVIPFDRAPYEIRMLDHEMNGVRDSAIQWIALANAWAESPFAMDPFGAEYLSEVLSMMMTLYIRRGELVAQEMGKDVIDTEVARRVRESAYVMVPSEEPGQAQWTEERKAAKQTLLASYDKALFRDVTASAGLPTKHVLEGAPLVGETAGGTTVAEHGTTGTQGHGTTGTDAHGTKGTKGHGTQGTKGHGTQGTKGHGTQGTPQEAEDGGFNFQMIMGAGIAVGDVNDDGYPDLFLNGESFGKLYVNRGKKGPGRFVESNAAWGLPDVVDDGHGALFFDMEGDGDLDLLVLRSEHPSLVIRQEDGKFVDVTEDTKIATHRGAHVASIFDADGDGDLDIYIGYYGNHESNMAEAPERNLPSMDGRNGSPNQLWRQEEDGTFKEDAEAMGLADTGWTLATSTFDADMDGDLDLYMANDFGANRMFFNEGGGKFTDATATTGTGDRGSGMNVDVTDVNADGYWDIYITNIDMFSKRIKVVFPRDESTITIDAELAKAFQYLSGNKFYVSAPREEPPYRAEEGLRFEPGDRGWGWDAAFFDYENDGDDDMYLTNGWITGSYAGDQPNQLFLAEDGHFVLGPEGSPETFSGNTRSAAAIDIDADGDVDLVVNQFRQAPRVLENRQRAGNRWVRVDLRGKGKNTRAIGALVKAKADGKTWMRQVTCGRGYLSQADIALTFGVGKAETVDLEIRWPDGETLSIAGVETNKTHRVEQGG